MGRLRSVCLASTGIMAMAAAQTVESSNASVSSNGAITLTLSMDDTMVPLASVLPLTAAAGQSLPPPGIAGSIFLANATSTFDVDSRNIAAINCDTVPGELQADYIFRQAVSGNASAVLFYSPSSERCTFEDYDGSYPWVYSMRTQSDSERLLEAVDMSLESAQALYAEIAWSDMIQVVGGDTSEGPGGRDLGSHAGDGDNDNDQDDSRLGASPTTAVAMIILYSITGIITALFLVIITTGAVRAHRHPERYGPRNIIGRPRQSRAKGIARAMLETLPVVKFGQRADDPKPTDVELADNGSGDRRESADGRSTTTPVANEPPSQQNDEPTQTTDVPRRQSTAEEGIAAAVTGARRDSDTPNPDHLGCSICTEDFEDGQDQRVLPCDHRFHPDCVDPWLLNVSGTCPLCRIDLHPPAEEQELDENGNSTQREIDENDNPLPLAGEGAEQRQRMSVRRSILIGLIGSRSVDRMTQEERLAILRQMRARRDRLREANARANAEAQAQQSEQNSQEDASRIRGRLRRVLGVRTRRTEARGQTEEQQ